MADGPIVWEVLAIAFAVFVMIAAITILVVVCIAFCRRRPQKSVRHQQYDVDTNGSGNITLISNQSKSFTQASIANANTNADVSNPRPPYHHHHHHRRHLVYYLDGDLRNPFIGLKNMFGRQPESSSFISDSGSDSLAISPSHPAIFGGGKDMEMFVKVKCVLTPPTPSRASGNPRERRASMADWENSA